MDGDKMGLFAPDGSPRADRLIEETEHAIRNTRAFLEKIQKGEEATRRYVENITAHLESDLRRLERERREREEKSEE